MRGARLACAALHSYSGVGGRGRRLRLQALMIQAGCLHFLSLSAVSFLLSLLSLQSNTLLATLVSSMFGSSVAVWQ